jgi:hypothetical protein
MLVPSLLVSHSLGADPSVASRLQIFFFGEFMANRPLGEAAILPNLATWATRSSARGQVNP